MSICCKLCKIPKEANDMSRDKARNGVCKSCVNYYHSQYMKGKRRDEGQSKKAQYIDRLRQTSELILQSTVFSEKLKQIILDTSESKFNKLIQQQKEQQQAKQSVPSQDYTI